MKYEGKIYGKVAGKYIELQPDKGDASHIGLLKHEFLFEIKDKQDYVDNMFERIKPFTFEMSRIICIDSQGHCATTGWDIEKVEQLNTFPVKIYRLARIPE